jgi:hypothetical protein
MTEYFWPTDIVPSSMEWRVIDSTAVFNSALSGTTRTVSRPGIRMGCTLNFTNLNRSDRSRVQGLISALRGRSNRIWLEDEGYERQGSFPAVELLPNVTFSSTTGWTSSNAELVISADSGRLRATRTAIAADRVVYSSAITTVTSAQYLFRGNAIQGRGNIRYSLRLGTTAGGLEVGQTAISTANGSLHMTAAASGTTTYAAIADYISGRAIDNFQLIEGLSFARCALVNGASQTGSSLWIDQLPVSTTGVLKAGDLISVYTTTWELKRLTADLNSNASAQGQVLFEPPLRSSPADNAPIAIHRPLGKFLLADDEVSWSTEPGLVSNFSLSFVEDVS